MNMGQSMADFGSVPTAGLVDRVNRMILMAWNQIENNPLLPRAMKRRRQLRLEQVAAQINAFHELVTAGEVDEQIFRAKLIASLDPNVSGGSQGFKFQM
jgi:hypothetical protein